MDEDSFIDVASSSLVNKNNSKFSLSIVLPRSARFLLLIIDDLVNTTTYCTRHENHFATGSGVTRAVTQKKVK